MCYAIPGKIKSLTGSTVVVDYFGEEKKAINEFYDVKIGDYICAQGGYVIKKIEPAEASQILQAWGQLFFELQDIDLRLSRLDRNTAGAEPRLMHILDKALKNFKLTNEELLYLLRLNQPQSQHLLFKAANFLRQKFHKNSCCVHGIIEISNYCGNLCMYCGIRNHNQTLRRYRMSPGEIIETAANAVERFGFQALVLQSGRDSCYDTRTLSEIIKKIKAKVPVLICISFGEIGLNSLKELFLAGARGLLLRFETSNPALYKKLHPGQDLNSRILHLQEARRLGYLIMTGSLIGLPGQTHQDIINDINLATRLGAEMYSFGPFLPAPSAPLGDLKAPGELEVLKVLALIRLINPRDSKILVTTALETLNASALKSALLAGANSLMLNTTPLNYRPHYKIYPNKAYSTEPIERQIEKTVSLLKALGRAPTDLGVS